MASGKIKSIWKFIHSLLSIQLLSLFLTGAGVFAILFANHTERNIPTTLSAGVYFILCATFGPYVVYQRGFVHQLKQYWWKFMIIGFLDFYSTHFQTVALSYTSVSSNQVLTTGLYALIVVILEFFTRKARFKVIHCILILISISGGTFMIMWQNAEENENTGSYPNFGDMLSVLSAYLTVLATVSKGYLIKDGLSITEFMCLLGFSGTVISSIQLCVLDQEILVEIEWDFNAVFYLLGCHLCCYCYYIFLPLVAMRLSPKITAVSSPFTTIYSLMFAIFMFNYEFSEYYIGGYMVIVFGLILYIVTPTTGGNITQSVFSAGFWYSYGCSLFSRTGDGLLDEWLSDLDDCYALAQQAKNAKWRNSIAAGDSDLENLLEDLRKVTEETAVATTTRNTRRSTHKPSEDLELSRGEFASFIQNVELSDVVHIPSSLTSCEPVNRSRRNSLVSDEDVLMKRNKTNRLLSMPCTGRLRVQRPSSVTAPRSRSHEQLHKHLRLFAQQLKVDEELTPGEQVMKNIKEARLSKMIIKVINEDGSSKMVTINKEMEAYDVCMMLAEKNRKNFEPTWTLVERLEDFDLSLERALEDHEVVVEALSHWPKGHHNTIHFRNNPDKYLLFTKPQMLVPDSHSLSPITGSDYFDDETKKKIILNEIFKDGIIPQAGGELHYKEGQNSSWKKQYFYIRTSGFYMAKSGKIIRLSDDLHLVAIWSEVCVYGSTVDHRKYSKTPSDFCFSLVPNGPIEKVHNSIKYFCLPSGTKRDLDMWITTIRIAKYGNQLLTDYETMLEKCELIQQDSDDLDWEDNPDVAEDELNEVEDELEALRSYLDEEVTKVAECDSVPSATNLNSSLASGSPSQETIVCVGSAVELADTQAEENHDQ